MTDAADSAERELARLLRSGRRAEAIEACRRLLALNPSHADAWYNLGFLLKEAGAFDEALGAYQKALDHGAGGAAEIRLNRAVIYSDHLRCDDAAENELRAALAIEPDYAPALLNLGNLCEERGAREAAVACYERLLAPAVKGEGANASLRAEAAARLIGLRGGADANDPEILRAREMLKEPGIDALARANLGFALGRAYDGIGLYDEAFSAWAGANAVARRAGRPYDRKRVEAAFGAVIAAFPEASAGAPSEGPSPIFICGMFRSGSTLLEQALCGHERVAAGGELDIVPRMAAGPVAPFPAAAARLSDEDAVRLARGYRAEIERLFPEDARAGRMVTDKRPDNFLFIGLIRRLFPAAKIIHTLRHPFDTGLSIFSQHLDARVMSYSTDLADIGHYFGQYRRLMAHWRDLFGDAIYDFDYDAFVRDPKPALAGVLAYCGLDWSDACLDVHLRRNTVKTASYWQVRKPVHAGASGRWRNYAAHLGPLQQALAAAGVDADD